MAHYDMLRARDRKHKSPVDDVASRWSEGESTNHDRDITRAVGVLALHFTTAAFLPFFKTQLLQPSSPLVRAFCLLAKNEYAGGRG